MAYRLPPLAWLRAFEASARQASFSAAAIELNLTAAAVSHQVRCLEHHFGHALFVRLPRGVRLTEIGKAYLPSVRRAFDDLSVSTAGLFGAGAGASVRVRASVSFAALVLAPLLPSFHRSHPEIRVQVSTAVFPDGGTLDGIDVDIRFSDGRWPEAERHSLGREASILVATRAFAVSAGTTPADIAAAGVIRITGCDDLWSALSLRHFDGSQGLEVARVDNSLVALELAARGLGCLQVLRSFAAPYLAAGTLVEPFPICALDHDQSHQIVIPSRRERPRPETRIFAEWVCGALSPATA